MNVEKIASDMAKKSYLSRKLGGVVKVGNYTSWAEKYQSLANDHYAKLLSEKRGDSANWHAFGGGWGEDRPNLTGEMGIDGTSIPNKTTDTKGAPEVKKDITKKDPPPDTKELPMDPLLSHTLIGGGIGAGLGALGGLAGGVWKGKKLKHTLRDALSYGLLGGLGGAGLGAAYKIYNDPNAVDRAVTRAAGAPARSYPNPELSKLDTAAKKTIADEKSKVDQRYLGWGAAIGAGLGGAAPLVVRGATAALPQRFTPQNPTGVATALAGANVPSYHSERAANLTAPLTTTARSELISELQRTVGLSPTTGAADPKGALSAMAEGKLPRINTIAHGITHNPENFYRTYGTAPKPTWLNPEGLQPKIRLMPSQRAPGPGFGRTAARAGVGATGGGLVGGLTALGSTAYGFGNDPTKPSEELSLLIRNVLGANIDKVTDANLKNELAAYLDLAQKNSISPKIYSQLLPTLESIFASP